MPDQEGSQSDEAAWPTDTTLGDRFAEAYALQSLDELDRSIQLTYDRRGLLEMEDKLTLLSAAYGSLASMERMAERLQKALASPAIPPIH